MIRLEAVEPLLTQAFWTGEEPVMLVGRGVPEPDFTLPTLPTGAVLFGTSGSSGVVKWVVHTRATLQASAQAVNAQLAVTAADVLGLLLPVYHVGGFGIVARAYVAGARCVWEVDKWEVARAYAFLVEQEVTVTSLVPTQLYDLVTAGLAAPAASRAIVIGGGALPDDLGRAARALGWPVLASYGMSEAGSQIATERLSALERPYDAGRPLPLLPVWQADVEDGRLRISGAALSKGILFHEGARYVPHTHYLTADRVDLQPEGVRFLGRGDRQVKVKGELVDLDALEQQLRQQEWGDVALIPVPDARDGHRVYAVSESPIPRAALQHHLPPYLTLAGIRQVDRLYRTPLGKIDRRRLRALF